MTNKMVCGKAAERTECEGDTQQGLNFIENIHIKMLFFHQFPIKLIENVKTFSSFVVVVSKNMCKQIRQLSCPNLLYTVFCRSSFWEYFQMFMKKLKLL